MHSWQPFTRSGSGADHGTYFFTTRKFTKDPTIIAKGSLVKGECGVTKFQQLGPNQPAVPRIMVTQNHKIMIIGFLKYFHSAKLHLQAQAKIRTAVLDVFPSFDSFDDQVHASKLMNVPAGHIATNLALDLDKFMRRNLDSYAWIQVVAYKDGMPLEKPVFGKL